MEKKLTKKYGLITAICMVVGIVIGSGIFFKGQKVLELTKGNLLLSIIAWAVGGLAMIVCSLQFSLMATKYEKINGVVDYAEATCGEKYAYYLGWFLSTIYYPGMVSVLAWVSARYFGEILGWGIASAEVMTLAGFLLVFSFVLNTLSPKIAGYFQVSSTVIKLIPLVLMGVVGVLVGTFNGTLSSNFIGDIVSQSAGTSELFGAICATVFAYEGWIIATSINSEIKDSKRNLPIALVVGAFIVVLIYILYNVSIGGGASIQEITSSGATVSFYNIFGNVGGMFLNFCIIVSCLGTLNGLTIGMTRGFYSIAARNDGPNPKMFSQVDATTNMPTNSSLIGLLISALWLLYFFGANITSVKWFGYFNFDSSELPVITIYALYIPMIVMWIVKEKQETLLKRFIIPILTIIVCLFLIFVAVYSHGVSPYLTSKNQGKFSFPVLFYLIVFAVIMFIGFIFSNTLKGKNKIK